MAGAAMVENFLTGKIFFVATVDGDKPRVRPFGLAVEPGGRLYLATGAHKPSYGRLPANPNVEISAAAEDGEWLRLSGTAVFDDSEATRGAIFERFPFIKELYGRPGSPKLAPFWIENGKAVFERMNGEKREEIL